MKIKKVKTTKKKPKEKVFVSRKLQENQRKSVQKEIKKKKNKRESMKKRQQGGRATKKN